MNFFTIFMKFECLDIYTVNKCSLELHICVNYVLNMMSMIVYMTNAIRVHVFDIFFISQLPSVLEYFSYNLCFLTVLAGPTCTYKEYIEMVNGENFSVSM